jgi:hypothetical protein
MQSRTDVWTPHGNHAQELTWNVGDGVWIAEGHFEWSGVESVYRKEGRKKKVEGDA